ncbi:hypothetical protein Tsubulata_050193 [Turnera subulata]|uniref:FLZ-type domain-containing protein n=1 Tax=Turnera subulata TaxID=218843 RepID=A0A9Q0FDC2_9ROSI|nr:hypothetical protein Tsubulata_050193 [Turnera subulata]
MLTEFTNPLKMVRVYTEKAGSKPTRASPTPKKVAAVGLQIITLVHISSEEAKPNVVMKSAVKRQRLQARQTCKIDDEYSCYLKSCFLCNKTLSLDKDVYMYRGDQGFCSVQCRDRQIYSDEMRELEASTKKTINSYRYCSGDDRRETRLLLEELSRRRRINSPPPHHHRNHWTIVS